jgi:hypothetical protein
LFVFFRVTDDFMPKEAAALFKNPDVTPASEVKLEWKAPDVDGLIDFLVAKKGFNLERVQGALKRLQGARGKANQQRIEGFFGAPKAAVAASAASAAAAAASSSAATASAPAAAAADVSAPAAAASSSFIGHAPGIVFEKPNKRKVCGIGRARRGQVGGLCD